MKTYIIILLFVVPVSLFAQKWDKYLFASMGEGITIAKEQNVYPRSILQNKDWSLTGNVGFRANYNSSKLIAWGTGVELSTLRGTGFYRAYSTVIGLAPYVRSDFNAIFVNVPVYTIIKTNISYRNCGYLIAGSGISYSPFGLQRDYLVQTSNNLSETTTKEVQSGTYSFENMFTAFISVGVGANFTLASRSCIAELTYLADVLDWEYMMHNPYSNANVSESFRRQNVQLKFGMRLIQ